MFGAAPGGRIQGEKLTVTSGEAGGQQLARIWPRISDVFSYQVTAACVLDSTGSRGTPKPQVTENLRLPELPAHSSVD